MAKLTIKQEKFVQELLACGNQSEAYRRAYDVKKMSQGAISIEATRLVNNPAVALRLAELQQKVEHKAIIDAAAVVQHLAEIALADHNELVEYRRVNCRYCNGVGFEFQWRNEAEFFKALEDWEDAKEIHEKNVPNVRFKRPMPSDAGGYGFKRNGKRHEDCPECEGEGEEQLFVKDTRELSASAKRLYAGVKRTKNGIEVMTHSQDNARKLLGDHFGLFKTIVESNNTNNNTNVNVDANEVMSKEDLLEQMKKRGLPTTVFDKRKQ